MTKLLVLAAAAAAAAAAACVTTQARAQIASCAPQLPSTVGGLTITPCAATTYAVSVTGPLEANYGQVEVSLSASGAAEIDKGVGRILRSLFGVKDSLEAAVTLEIYKNDVLIYQKPVLTLSVAKDGKTTANLATASASHLKASPAFVLGGSTAIKSKLKVSLVTNQQSGAVETVKDGFSAAAALGGPQTLLTGTVGQAFFVAAARGEAAVNDYFSSVRTNTNEQNLDFYPGANKTVGYSVSLPPADKKSQASRASVTVNLVTFRSLTVDESYLPVAGQPPSWTPPAARLSSRIVIDASKTPISTLATQIDGEGLPRALSDLKVDPAKPDDAVSRLDQVAAACKSLRDAIEAGSFQLSGTDFDLVLYDELLRAGVFAHYSPNELLPCTLSMVPRWAAYGIVVPGPTSYPITRDEGQNRLTALATDWELADKAMRERDLPDNFLNPVQLTAAPDFLSSAPSAVDGPLPQRPVSPSHFGDRQKTCFGNYRPPPDGSAWATAFAQFEGDPKSYLVKAEFQTTRPPEHDGPLISAITIREATADDKKAYDQNGKCLK